MKLETRGLACGYGGSPILENVNFSVQSGEICCLLGPNGVGKTTLFRTVLKLMKPLDGKILVDGDDIARWGPSQLSKAMAYVSQYHVPPFPYLVKDVVLLGRLSSVGYFGQPKKRDLELVDIALKAMGILHLKEKVYTDISGGERQLVMIARAMVQQAKILVLDEPTASLDYGNTIRVLKMITKLRDIGFGIIMTTHSPDQAFMCDSKVVLLQRKKPAIFGDTVDVITEKNLKEAYGVNVHIVQFPDRKGRIMHMCAPEI
ncbi:MAG: ABC transporter ATP-binding protein [Firmicutes bacterium]|nr:ABC transporter ATP-binding protein [Bacillota bacterium]